MVGARSGGTSTPLSAAAFDVQVGHRLAAHLALVLEGKVGAHLAQGHVEPGAQGVDADVLDRDVAARADRGGHHGEGGRRGIARARQCSAPSALASPDHGDPRAAPASLEVAVPCTSAPKWRSMRSVWSRVGSGSITVVSPAVLRPASRIAALHLGRGHGQPVFDRHHLIGADNGQRQAPAVAASKRAPMRDSGSITRFIGRRAQRGIAGQEGLVKRMAGQDAGQQPGGGAGVAQFDNVLGRAATAHAEAADPPQAALALMHDDGAEGTQGGGGAQHVLALEQAAHRVSPSARAPNIRARCEIDLSPGATVRPVSRGTDRATSLAKGALENRARSQKAAGMRRRALLPCGNLVLTG